MPKLVWRVKLVAELRPGVMTETEVACIERNEQAGVAELGLRFAETKQLTEALQAEIVPAQLAVVGEQRRSCVSCGCRLASKSHYPLTFRSLFAGRGKQFAATNKLDQQFRGGAVVSQCKRPGGYSGFKRAPRRSQRPARLWPQVRRVLLPEVEFGLCGHPRADANSIAD